MCTMLVHLCILYALISGCLSENHSSKSLPDILAVKISTPILRYNKKSAAVVVEADTEVKMEIIGMHMESIESLKLVDNQLGAQTNCNIIDGQPLTFSKKNMNTPHFGQLVEVDSMNLVANTADAMYFLCVETNNNFIAFNRSDLAIIAIKVEKEKELLSIPLKIIIVVCLMMLSGLFSGLSLGLMSLTPAELQLVINAAENEKHVAYAQVLYPVRKQGNFLLYGLAVGAHTIWLTKGIMLLTAPLSWPIAKILDVLLNSEEYSREGNRDKMFDFMKIQCENEGSGSQKAQMDVLKSAMNFGQKTVKDKTTYMDKIFALEENMKLSRKKLVEIAVAGHTRIPVYSGEKNNITMMLNVKDLAILDPDDEITVGKVAKKWDRPIQFVPSSMKLIDCLTNFQGGKAQVLIVREGEEGAALGMITLEDVVECLVGGDEVAKTDESIAAQQKVKKKEERRAKRILKNVLGPKEAKKSTSASSA